MSDLGVLRWIRELDENGAVALARALIFAEAGRHGLPLNEFTMSGRVKARDQGVDGRTNFPDEPGVLLPSGRCVWQVKSGGSSPSSTAEFDREKHPGLVRAIEGGHDYVLFWTNDPADPTLTTVINNFTEAAREIRDNVVVTPLFGDAIERLCRAHLGVLVQQSSLPLGGVVGLPVWAPDEFAAVAFQLDAEREDYIEVLRSHVSSEATPAELHVYGDTGVGKSRLVHEALDVDGIRERVLVVPDASQWDSSLLTMVAQSDERSLVLVVDDCDAEERRSLARYSGMARGRIRLITVGSRATRELSVHDDRYLELMPLAAAAAREIALSVGLSETDADLVATYTEGYPGLALTLAKAIAHGGEDHSLIERIRGHEEVGGVLSSLLPDADVPRLGMLALFEKLGYEGDLAPELTIACEALSVDEAALRTVADRELRRFVSTAGRFRRVTPRLFAVWLASQFMQHRQETLAQALTELPPSLQDRILAQMRDFADDPVVTGVLGALLRTDPFRSGALGDVGEGAARLLHVAAIASPNAAMDAVDRVMDGVPIDALQSYGPGRRELVWSLEVLLWFEHLFDRAADALIRLALAENETWGNNSTGVIQGVFRVYLGGTGAPYDQRLRWARRVLDEHPEATGILVGGLRHALDIHESRGSPSFGGRSAPQEWRPTNVEEEVDARGGAWDLLIEIARGSEEHRPDVADVLADGLRTAIRRGLYGRVVADLRGIRWSAPARGRLGEAITATLKYDDPPEDIAAGLRALASELRGRSLQDQLDYVLSAAPWQLTSEDEEAISGRPSIVRQLAVELGHAGVEMILDAAARSREGHPQTAGVLFEEVGHVLDDTSVLSEVEAIQPTPNAAVLGLMKGLSDSRDAAWSDDVLRRWSDGPLGGLVVAGAHLLPTSNIRAELSIEVVDRGLASPQELGRFLQGAWAQELDAAVLADVLDRLRSTGGGPETEAALGILEQWLEIHQPSDVSPRLRAIAVALVYDANTLSDRSSAMLGLYRSRVIDSIGLQFEERLPLVLDLLEKMDGFPDSYDLSVLDSLMAENATDTTRAVVGLLVGAEAESFRPSIMWIEDAKLLSRLERVGSTETVVSEMLEQVPEHEWPKLIGHIDFESEDPDPALVAMLERSSNDLLWGRALSRLMYPAGAWSGSESARLRESRNRALRWRELGDAPQGLIAWLDFAVGAIDDRIEAAELEEAERGY